VLRLLGSRLMLRVVRPRRNLVVVERRLWRLVLHVCRRHACLRHDVTALTEQALVDRQVIVSGCFGCHCVRSSIMSRGPIRKILSDTAEPRRDAVTDREINHCRQTEIEENAKAFCVHGENVL
jgi:hypothetical protein